MIKTLAIAQTAAVAILKMRIMMRRRATNEIKNNRAGVKVTRGEKSANTGTRLGEYTVSKMGVRTNIWRYHAGNNGDDLTDHEAPFPEALARDHIISWSNPGDVVLDPFAGSGTTPKMASLLDRRFIGIEISAEYCEMARERVRAAAAQPKLIPFEGNGAAQATHSQATLNFD
jgi:DNA modification methylase